LEFSDNGKGMDAAHLSRIFEPFYTTRRGEGGSGLGLYICYNIVTNQLGGTIHCESQPEAGCRFDIHFSSRMMPQAAQGTP
jgi:signal transduction histidine kinase